jgi:SAM-dependent methyltransferase
MAEHAACEPGPDAAFWNARFLAADTPWDRGAPGPQLVAWCGSGALRPCRIAVPGCGSGWEVAELARRGFEVTAIDCAPAACDRARARLAAEGLRAEVLRADVLDFRPGRPFDAVYEQTCLCAIHPSSWRRYEESVAAWLRPGGTLFLMCMQAVRPGAAEGLVEGPPYHCDINAMRMLFDDARWQWPAPPAPAVPHPRGWTELGVALVRHG